MIIIFLLSWLWWVFAIVAGSNCWTPIYTDDAFEWTGVKYLHEIKKEATVEYQWLPYHYVINQPETDEWRRNDPHKIE